MATSRGAFLDVAGKTIDEIFGPQTQRRAEARERSNSMTTTLTLETLLTSRKVRKAIRAHHGDMLPEALSVAENLLHGLEARLKTSHDECNVLLLRALEALEEAQAPNAICEQISAYFASVAKQESDD